MLGGKVTSTSGSLWNFILRFVPRTKVQFALNFSFQRLKTDLKERISAIGRNSAEEAVVRREIVALQKTVTDNVSRIPSYDQQQYTKVSQHHL